MAKHTSKERIIHAALRRFSGDGYLSTSVDDIIEEAGVSKGSFYHAFKSKEMLGLETMEHYLQHVNQTLRNGPYQEVEDPLERTIAYVQHVEDQSSVLWKNGCMMGSFSVDLARGHPAVQKKLKTMFVGMEENLVRLFEPMVEQATHDVPSATQLARQFISLVQGAIVLSQAHGDVTIIRDSIRTFRHYLESLRD